MKNRNIDVDSEALQYGFGVFETILVKNNILIDFDLHYSRLVNSMEKLNMNSIKTKDEILNDIKLFLGEKISIGVLKISCYLNGNITEIFYYKKEFSYKDEHYKNGFRVCISKNYRHSKNPIYQIKSTNFLNNYLEMKYIKENKFDESLHLNENEYITECVYSNIFFVKNNVLYTPDIKAGLLPGIQRQNIIDLARKLEIKVKIGYYSIDDIKNAEEFFLTSSLLSIMKVKVLDDKVFDFDKFVITNKLNKEML